VGSYAICPECAPSIRETSEESDEPVMECPSGMRFREWVLTLRDGRNTIEISTF